jgi:ketosteroid isomerase-like protein
MLLALWLGNWQSASAAGPRVHDSKRNEKREIEELEEQWRKALVTADVAMTDTLLSEDFVGISMTGQANTKSQQLDRLRNRRLVITKMDLSDSKVKLVGQIAIVTSLAQIEGTNEGQPMTGNYRYTRVYQRLPSGIWKTTNFEATRVPANRLP